MDDGYDCIKVSIILLLYSLCTAVACISYTHTHTSDSSTGLSSQRNTAILPLEASDGTQGVAGSTEGVPAAELEPDNDPLSGPWDQQVSDPRTDPTGHLEKSDDIF